MSSAAICLEGITKTFDGTQEPAVAPLDLTLGAGEISVLIGPSGCGKTTTMRMINRLIEPTDGRVTIGGTDVCEQEVTELRRGIGYVIQQVGLFPHRTVAQNIAAVPTMLGWDSARTAERVDELTELVGLDATMMDRYPAELSGGQQQRVGVARALAADPPVLLMDEPFGAVDPIIRGRLQQELRELQERLRKTIVLVTHDIDEAVALGDKVAVLNVGGVLEQFATPDDLLAKPANGFVESFLGSERSLKRLSLVQVGDLDLAGGPIVATTASVTDARRVLGEWTSAWLGLVGPDDRFAGWVPADALDGQHALTGLSPEPAAVEIAGSATLRQALEAILNSQSEVAVVVGDDGRFRGAVTLGAIRQELVT
ncbi:ATP-binding cassette domain-containing protein [soil metagenome]